MAEDVSMIEFPDMLQKFEEPKEVDDKDLGTGGLGVRDWYFEWWEHIVVAPKKLFNLLI